MRKLFCICCCLGLLITGYAQKANSCSFASFTKDYKRLIALQPTENYQVGITTTYYGNQTDSVARLTERAMLKVLTENSYIYRNGNKLQVQENSIRLDVDTTTKQILVSKSNPFSELMLNQKAIENLDSTNYKITKLVTKKKIVYEVQEQKQASQYKTIRFSFNVSDNHFLEMELILWPNNYLKDQLEDESMESPRIVFSYTTFKSTDRSSISGDERLDYWLKDEKSTPLVSKKEDYKIYDLR